MKINDWMIQMNKSLEEMHRALDSDGDGAVSKQEFNNEMSRMAIPGLSQNDYNRMYDVMDLNKNGELSVNEFGYYVKGAVKKKADRIS